MRKIRGSSLTWAVIATALVGWVVQAGAASTTPSADEKSFITLKGSRSVLASVAHDNGRAGEETTLRHLRIVLSRSAEQQQQLDQFEAELLENGSVNFKKWLTPEQFGRLYGPADSEIQAIVAWLQSNGFTVEAMSPGQTDIAFSGSVHQAEEAFHTAIHSYQALGQRFYSPAADLVIPAAFKTLIAGVAGLNTFHPAAAYVMGPTVTYDSELKQWSRVKGEMPTVQRGMSSEPYLLAVTPADAATVYNAPNPILNTNYRSGIPYTGKGVTIGLVGDAPIRDSIVANYRARFLGDTAALLFTNVDGDVTSRDANEAYIDTELAGALAPAASIHLYTAADVFTAIERAISDNTVDILSVGFTACSTAYSPAERRLIQEWLGQAAAQGIAVTVAAGNTCGNTLSNRGAANGPQVNAFASTPYNIAVGGTDTEDLAGGISAYVNASSNPSRYYGSAFAYIPESAWNDSTLIKGISSSSAPPGDIQTADAGKTGDCSTYSLNSMATAACSGGSAKPAWQRGKGVPEDRMRDIPDLSIIAGEGVHGSGWAVCIDSTLAGSDGIAADCALQPDGRFYLRTFGGTSTAASALAGILALVQEKAGERLGQAATELYDLYNGPNGAAIFHHIAGGNNDVATAGYDLATGLGSVDVAQLVKYWGSATGTGAATVTATASATTVDSVAGFAVSVTVSGGTLGTPTGTVVLQSGSFNSGTQTLSAGSFTFHVAPGSIAVGTDTLTVSYSGNSNYAAATGSATVTVTPTTPTLTVTPSTHTLNSNAALNVVANVNGSGGVIPTGTVALSGGGYTSSAQALANGAYAFAIPAFSLSAGALTLTVNYGGDSLYSATTGSTNVNVTRSTFTLTVTDLVLTAGALTNNASHVTVTPAGSYTGTVTLTAAIASSPAGAGSPPALTGSSVTITSGPATGFITVATTPVPAAKRGPLAQSNHWFRAGGTTMLAALLFLLLPGRIRRCRAGFIAVLLFVSATLFAIGCGSDSKKTPTVTVMPAQATAKAADAVSVAVTVAGTGSATPTGTVTLSSGSFSTSGNLANGSANLSIPGNTLTAGKSSTITVTYSGDKHYLTATGSATVSVLAPGTTPGAYTVTVTGTGNDPLATTATASFTLTVK